MKITIVRSRRLMLVLSRLATVVAGVMLVMSALAMWPNLDRPTVSAAPSGSQPQGIAVLNPSTGDTSSAINLSLDPSPAFCPGDTATGGYLWQGFLTPVSNDPGTLTYGNTGPIGPAPTLPLVPVTGPPLTNKSVSTPEGQIIGLDPIKLFSYGGKLVSGDYWIGVACTIRGETAVFAPAPAGSGRAAFWATRVTITVAGSAVSYQVAPVPPPPPPSSSTPPPSSSTPPPSSSPPSSSTPTTTVVGATTTVAGATTTTVAGTAAQTATLSPAVPTAGAPYKVTHPNCRVGDTITFTQPQSTPTSPTATCALPVAGLVRPEQAAALGTATVNFTAAPTTPGSYTVTSSGSQSGTRSATFVIVGATSPVVVPTTVASTGGSPSGGSIGSIPATGSSTTSVIVWGMLLLVFGRMAILFGRKPKVISASR